MGIAIRTRILCLALLIIMATLGNSESIEDEIPMTKLTQNVGAPTLKFFYCYQCGYRKMYEQYAEIIQQKYPFISMEGSNYEPPGISMFLSRLIGLLKMFLILCILAGVNIFEYINQPRPSWWTWCTENKIYACMMLFFLSNIIEVQLVQSGAFEILLNDVPVWSKLETGRIPQPAELFQIIDNHMRFDTKLEYNNGFAK
ncbi:thioredoxin reductase-like selenoprotein T homolog CG3887 [Coccinella septempunctata]|uniref:thioredoxin reductase-like selenoprotein T homolog CG3887 n=1 Tax=Coccinella septempunctata TaxID=41139 RepID=UPI001D091F7C|nr:thioredoxin reductase-like selenoprotein T homolog CG3887 [Coccinella septempunctata]